MRGAHFGIRRVVVTSLILAFVNVFPLCQLLSAPTPAVLADELLQQTAFSYEQVLEGRAA
jgi:hypothetical protein